MHGGYYTPYRKAAGVYPLIPPAYLFLLLYLTGE
jgi:hypothetical protein